MIHFLLILPYYEIRKSFSCEICDQNKINRNWTMAHASNWRQYRKVQDMLFAFNRFIIQLEMEKYYNRTQYLIIHVYCNKVVKASYFSIGVKSYT